MGDISGVGGNTLAEQIRFNIIRLGQFYEISEREMKHLAKTVRDDGAMPLKTYLFLENFMDPIKLGRTLSNTQNMINKNIGNLVLVASGIAYASKDILSPGVSQSVVYDLGSLVINPIEYNWNEFLVSIPVNNHIRFYHDFSLDQIDDYEKDSIVMPGEKFKYLNEKLPNTIAGLNYSNQSLCVSFDQELIYFALSSKSALLFMFKQGFDSSKIEKDLKPDCITDRDIEEGKKKLKDLYSKH